MVNQAEQDNTSSAEPTQDNNNGDTLVDVTSEFEGANTFEDTPTPTEETTDTPPPPENVETPTETTEKRMKLNKQTLLLKLLKFLLCLKMMVKLQKTGCEN